MSTLSIPHHLFNVTVSGIVIGVQRGDIVGTLTDDKISVIVVMFTRFLFLI
jgi:hypothetical protein